MSKEIPNESLDIGDFINNLQEAGLVTVQEIDEAGDWVKAVFNEIDDEKDQKVHSVQS